MTIERVGPGVGIGKMLCDDMVAGIRKNTNLPYLFKQVHVDVTSGESVDIAGKVVLIIFEANKYVYKTEIGLNDALTICRDPAELEKRIGEALGTGFVPGKAV